MGTNHGPFGVDIFLCSQREGNRWHLGSISHTGTSMTFCPYTTQSVFITWARYILLILRSKARQRASLLLFIYILLLSIGFFENKKHYWNIVIRETIFVDFFTCRKASMLSNIGQCRHLVYIAWRSYWISTTNWNVCMGKIIYLLIKSNYHE